MSAHADWISKIELIQLTGWTERTVHRKDASGEIKSRPTDEISRNGKPLREYDAKSLPAEFQAKRVSQAIQSVALVPVKHSETAVATLPAPDRDGVRMALASYSKEEQAQARERMEVIRPMIDFRNKTNGHKPVFAVGSGEEIT